MMDLCQGTSDKANIDVFESKINDILRREFTNISITSLFARRVELAFLWEIIDLSLSVVTLCGIKYISC